MKDKEVALLVVDDDDDARLLMGALLDQLITSEHNFVPAADAEEAIRRLEDRFFHLVLSDIQMPGKSGVELCQHIHRNYPNTVVILVSGMTDIHYAIAAIRAGAFDYLLKPVDALQLQESVERALDYQEMLMARYHCEQSLEEEVRDLFALNARLRAAHAAGRDLPYPAVSAQGK
ncbi:MAG TPA: response regulator [Blastocatellia bacterium]|nr:response regulator [Blastocatellia bacterium]